MRDGKVMRGQGFTSREEALEAARGAPDIFVMRADGSHERRLTHSAANDVYPGFSPNGRKIVFGSDRTGKTEIFAMRAGGSRQRRLTAKTATNSYPSFSPNGRKIVFSSDRDGNYEYLRDERGRFPPASPHSQHG